jgi:hypothetical protein
VALRGRPVLLDTNAILEAWRVRAWKALAGGHFLETVEMVVAETHTGFQRRSREQQIDQTVLRQSLKAIHVVSDLHRAALALQVPDIALDPGERDLWAHALTRQDAWVLCGPDKASLRVGVRLGFREQLVSLETLVGTVGLQARTKLREQFTSRWLSTALSAMVVAEGRNT